MRKVINVWKPESPDIQQTFFSLKYKPHLSIGRSHLLKPQFFIILTWNVIFGLKLGLPALQLVEF